MIYKVTIIQKWKNIFDKEIKCREKIHNTPLPKIQKIKAARKISHLIFPLEKCNGVKGHDLRQVFIKEILKTINVNYNIIKKVNNYEI